MIANKPCKQAVHPFWISNLVSSLMVIQIMCICMVVQVDLYQRFGIKHRVRQ